MSRPTKTGLGFYSNDTDRYQDIKIRRLNQNFGSKGIAIWDYLLNETYRVEGSYLQWDENTAFVVAEFYNDVNESLVNEVVNYCCHVGLFNKELRISENVLTSKRIQLQYLHVCKMAKRTKINIPVKIDLIGFRKKKPKFPLEETKQTQEETTQSKVKERKEDESKLSGEKIQSELSAYEFLKKEDPVKVEAFEMQNKRSIPNFEVFITNFESKVIEEKLPFESKILHARLIRLNANWDKSKKPKNTESESMSNKVGERLKQYD